MLYLSEKDIVKLKLSWPYAIDIIEKASNVISLGEYSQPIKPYLRFKNFVNRIIAMPSYIGGNFDISGIKWISSFPDNLKSNLPRAHSVTILNSSDTGEPIAILNSRLLSAFRTVAVSGLMLRRYLSLLSRKNYFVGICGFGVIGKLHLDMLREIVGNEMQLCTIYDPILNPEYIKNQFDETPVQFVKSWQEAYRNSDIFITCTTSSSPYINMLPPLGSLQVNVSLRDYKPDILISSKHIVVDDWDEVCRENTDIHRAHLLYGLEKKKTYSFPLIASEEFVKTFDLSEFLESSFLHFNPMGMSVFDISLAKVFYNNALKEGVGTILNKEYANV